MSETSKRGVYRFVGGPWHNETHEMDGRPEWLVPMVDNLVAASSEAAADISASLFTGMQIAVYQRERTQWDGVIYRFVRMERR